MHTNIPFLREMLSHPEFIDGAMTTQFVGQHFPEGLATRERTELEKAFQMEAEKALLSSGDAAQGRPGFSDPMRLDAWRNV